MKKLFYPMLFHQAEEGGFWVSFPDLPECLTQGEDMEHAYEMAQDALGLALTCREKRKSAIACSSDPASIHPDPDSFLVIMEFDLQAYKKRTNSRAVKKTLSIPEWMNETAMAMNLNFSQLLQEAILAKIQAGVKMPEYSVLMYYDEQEQIYVASVPELQGCMAHGETKEKALKEIDYPNAAIHNPKGQAIH